MLLVAKAVIFRLILSVDTAAHIRVDRATQIDFHLCFGEAFGFGRMNQVIR
jgi:hypothetical protein